MTNPAVVVGGRAIADGHATLLRRVATKQRVGMLNTFAAKGLFAWSDPAHLGTIGLQESDLELAGLHDRDVLLIGVPEDEIGRDWLRAVRARWHDVEAGDLASWLHDNDDPTPRPALYEMLAAVCAPMYASDAVPMNPARAAADLASWLPLGGVVRADRDAAGFWLGRTFPTRELGSVRFDALGEPSRANLRVVAEYPSEPTGVDVVEVWSVDGPRLSASERLDRLQTAVDEGHGAVLPLGVDLSALDALVAVAGPPRWSGVRI